MTASAALEGLDLTRRYSLSGSGPGRQVIAVNRVSLKVGRGEILGIAGESGSGKSTLLRLLAGLEAPDSGQVLFDGRPVDALSGWARLDLRRRLQVVFQDAEGSLNPRLRILTSVSEPLAAQSMGTRAQRRARAEEALGLVGLDLSVASRRPATLSGGERQRAAIARALITRPELILLDEPVSSLDVVVQQRILELLVELRSRLDVAMLLITHDLAVVEAICNRVAVMLRGTIVESGLTGDVLANPMHPYTRLLLSCAPRAEPGWSPPLVPEPGRPEDRLAGACPFLDRCPLAVEACRQAPQLEPGGEQRLVACWLRQGLGS